MPEDKEVEATGSDQAIEGNNEFRGVVAELQAKIDAEKVSKATPESPEEVAEPAADAAPEAAESPELPNPEAVESPDLPNPEIVDKAIDRVVAAAYEITTKTDLTEAENYSSLRQLKALQDKAIGTLNGMTDRELQKSLTNLILDAGKHTAGAHGVVHVNEFPQERADRLNEATFDRETRLSQSAERYKTGKIETRELAGGAKNELERQRLEATRELTGVLGHVENIIDDLSRIPSKMDVYGDSEMSRATAAAQSALRDVLAGRAPGISDPQEVRREVARRMENFSTTTQRIMMGAFKEFDAGLSTKL